VAGGLPGEHVATKQADACAVAGVVDVEDRAGFVIASDGQAGDQEAFEVFR